MAWDQDTLGLTYAPDLVAERLRYYADEFANVGDLKWSTVLDGAAGDVEAGLWPAWRSARIVLWAAEELANWRDDE